MRSSWSLKTLWSLQALRTTHPCHTWLPFWSLWTTWPCITAGAYITGRSTVTRWATLPCGATLARWTLRSFGTSQASSIAHPIAVGVNDLGISDAYGVRVNIFAPYIGRVCRPLGAQCRAHLHAGAHLSAVSDGHAQIQGALVSRIRK